MRVATHWGSGDSTSGTEQPGPRPNGRGIPLGNAALVLAPFSQEAIEALRRIIPVSYESWTATRKLYSPDVLSDRINAEGINILIVEADFVFDEVFREARALRFLGVCRNSLDHVDLQAATEHGVTVVNAPARNAQAVAELTLGLMISLARGVCDHNGYVKSGKWESPVEPYISMRGVELQGKTLGIIGLGSIGKIVARLGRAFGMSVLAYDPYVGTPGSRRGSALLGMLDQVVQDSDFLSIHAPSTPETQGLLDRRRLGLMKRGSYIVNTAAYPIVDEEALADHLKSGHIAGAALDVHQTHPIPPTSPMLKLGNALLLPHVGGATDGTIMRQSWMMVNDIQRFLQGQRPRHLINREVWRRRG